MAVLLTLLKDLQGMGPYDQVNYKRDREVQSSKRLMVHFGGGVASQSECC
jgi:hypothetical protein